MGAFMELVKCTHDHDDYEFGYKSIEEKDYCCKGNYLNGVKCSVCALTFVSRRALLPCHPESPCLLAPVVQIQIL